MSANGIAKVLQCIRTSGRAPSSLAEPDLLPDKLYLLVGGLTTRDYLAPKIAQGIIRGPLLCS